MENIPTLPAGSDVSNNVDDDPQVQDKRRTVKVKAFGVEIELRGYDVIIVVVLGITVGLGVATYYTSAANAAAHEAIVVNQKTSANKSEEQLAEVIYILSLPENKRRDLQLAVPKSLRDKVKKD